MFAALASDDDDGQPPPKQQPRRQQVDLLPEASSSDNEAEPAVTAAQLETALHVLRSAAPWPDTAYAAALRKALIPAARPLLRRGQRVLQRALARSRALGPHARVGVALARRRPPAARFVLVFALLVAPRARRRARRAHKTAARLRW